MAVAGESDVPGRVSSGKRLCRIHLGIMRLRVKDRACKVKCSINVRLQHLRGYKNSVRGRGLTHLLSPDPALTCLWELSWMECSLPRILQQGVLLMSGFALGAHRIINKLQGMVFLSSWH